jgi:SAM-dependent methyltransferase
VTDLVLHPFASYWDKGVANVPDMTGARHLLDAEDFPVIFQSLGMPARLPNVLDVGCGTGRILKHCDVYLGADIAPSMVEYCRLRGIKARLTVKPDDLPSRLATIDGMSTFDWVTCISVFTHIDKSERQAYLAVFNRTAPNVLVDIIPGDGSGNVAVWTAVPSQFEDDCRAAGFEIVAQADHQWDMHTHRYYRLRRSR